MKLFSCVLCVLTVVLYSMLVCVSADSKSPLEPAAVLASADPSTDLLITGLKSDVERVSEIHSQRTKRNTDDTEQEDDDEEEGEELDLEEDEEEDDEDEDDDDDEEEEEDKELQPPLEVDNGNRVTQPGSQGLKPPSQAEISSSASSKPDGTPGQQSTGTGRVGAQQQSAGNNGKQQSDPKTPQAPQQNTNAPEKQPDRTLAVNGQTPTVTQDSQQGGRTSNDNSARNTNTATGEEKGRQPSPPSESSQATGAEGDNSAASTANNSANTNNVTPNTPNNKESTTTTTTLPPEPTNNKKGDADSSSSISSSVWVRVPLLIVVTLACIHVC
ncbi:uncharacterized protein TM35_001051020 [Trypanosoma theileri]|uniref:Mucin-associated surface protein (MASP) n=1 Tax=Trypanosoma theileri TaxID=67003 RepID=A0A1X0NE53_9TRYP|nr:uncharacterized protein TM35_001051020 [Trypanosoma theileri]ORC81845.1 hypothetical protein TM35_001051020 [Trypanosoma theileri]